MITRYEKERKRCRDKAKEYRNLIRRCILGLLGDKCKWCGCKDKRVLEIDHIKGHGNRERKVRGYKYMNYIFYLRVLS